MPFLEGRRRFRRAIDFSIQIMSQPMTEEDERLMCPNRKAWREGFLSGIDVMKEIKDVESPLLVIIASACGDGEVAIEAFRSGACEHPAKPFSISEFPEKADFYPLLRHAVKQHRKNALPGSATPARPESPPSAISLGQYHKIQQAARFINDNCRTDICLDAVAAQAGMSPSHFSRTFKKVMGLSYREYLNNRRITKAKNLLLTSPQSVAEIAVSLGFSDPTGFGRIFKKLTGQTPTAYRSLAR